MHLLARLSLISIFTAPSPVLALDSANVPPFVPCGGSPNTASLLSQRPSSAASQNAFADASTFGRPGGLTVRQGQTLFGAYGDAASSYEMLGDCAQTRVPILGGAENGIGPGGVNGYGSIDAVGKVLQFAPPQPSYKFTATFPDSTHVTPEAALTAAQLAQIQVAYKDATGNTNPGTWLQTADGLVTFVTAKSTTSLTVKGWWQLGVQNSGYATPKAQTVYVNVFTKGFGVNWLFELPAKSYQKQGYLAEFDVVNHNPSATVDGLNIVSLGEGVGNTLLTLRGASLRPFYVQDWTVNGLELHNTLNAASAFSLYSSGDMLLYQVNGGGSVAQQQADTYGAAITHGISADQSVVTLAASGSVINIPVTTSWLHLMAGAGNTVGQEIITSPNPVNGQILVISTEAAFNGSYHLHSPSGSSTTILDANPPAPSRSAQYRYLAAGNKWVRLQ